MKTTLSQKVQKKKYYIASQRVSPTMKDRTWKKSKLLVPQKRYNVRSNTGTNFKSMAVDVLLVQHICSANHVFNPAGKKLSIDTLINGEDGDTRWKLALSNEWGRLSQGNNAGVDQTDTIKFVAFNTVPLEKKVAYVSFICNH